VRQGSRARAAGGDARPRLRPPPGVRWAQRREARPPLGAAMREAIASGS